MKTKKELREAVAAMRREFAGGEAYAAANAEICRNLRRLPQYRAARRVMIYLPLAGEVDVTALLADEKEFFVPVTKDAAITPAKITAETELVKGAFGISEPARPQFAAASGLDFIVVPAVAADRRGNRLGRGKGCYDRFLAGVDCPRAAVCFGFQLADEIETEPHDAVMDYIITEGGCVYGKF